MTSGVLEPLFAHHISWLDRPDADSENEDPQRVWAMPVVLRMERAHRPERTPLLEAAASAAVAVCLDERAEPGGPWHDAVHTWVSGRIRKVTRRARGSHWQAVQDLPGCTVQHNGAEVRALLPGPIGDAPKEVSRLQISGSDLPADDPGPASEDCPVVWLNPAVDMTAGKAAAQVGHATMLLAAFQQAEAGPHDPALVTWREAGYPCAVRTPEPHTWRAVQPGADTVTDWRERGVVAVRDAGFTEVDPRTVTVAAEWRVNAARVAEVSPGSTAEPE